MNYDFINERDEEEALRDVMHLHWWLKENVNKDDNYLSYTQPRYSNKSYITYALKADNSILTTSDGWKRFYAITENNKLLKCTFFSQKYELFESTINYRGIFFELYGDASSFVITKREETEETKITLPCVLTKETKTEYIQIIDSSGRCVTDNEERRISRIGQLELPNSIRLVDVLKPITVDDVLKAFEDAKNKSDSLLSQKEKNERKRKK